MSSSVLALVGKSFTQPNADFPLGSAVRIGFSIPKFKPLNWPEATFFSLQLEKYATYQTFVRQVLADIERSCGIDFVEVPESQARILFGVSDIHAGGGYAQTSYDTFQRQYSAKIVYDDDIQQAANFKTLILHEILHALGLKHPGKYTSTDIPPFLPSAEDNTLFTAMSYNHLGEDHLGLRPYDIATLQYLFGPPISAGTRVGLPSGASNRIGSSNDDLFALNSFDLWSLNSSSTIFKSTDGLNFQASRSGIFIDGGNGIDEAYINRPRNEVEIETLPTGNLRLTTFWTVTLSSGESGKLKLSDELRDIERISFSDGKLAFDLDGHAGQVAGLLFAVFGRPAVFNPEYVGVGLQILDSGIAYGHMASLAVAVSGVNTREGLVNLLWTNLAGSPPTDKQQTQPLVDILLEDMSNAGVLAEVAANFATTSGLLNLDEFGLGGLFYI